MILKPVSNSAASNTPIILAICAFAAVLFFAIRPNETTSNGESASLNQVASQNQTSSTAKKGEETSSKGNALLAKVNQTNTRQGGQATASATRASSDRFETLSIDELISTALAHGSRATREEMLAVVATQLAAGDLQTASNLVEEILGSKKTAHAAPGFVKAVIETLTKTDPAQAADWSQKLPEPLNILAMDTNFKHWVEADVFEAANWVSSIRDQNTRKNYTQQIGSKLLGSLPSGEVMDWVQNLAHSPDAADHIDSLSRIWAQNDSEQAYQWALSLEDRTHQATALVGVTSIKASNNLQAAESLLSSLPNEDGLRDQVIHTIAYELDGQSPGTGLDLARRLNHVYATERDLSAPLPSSPTPSN